MPANPIENEGSPMQRRKPPQPPSLDTPPARLRENAQTRMCVHRLLGAPDATIDDIDPIVLNWVLEEVMKRQDGDIDSGYFRRHMADLTPVLATPTLDDPARDTRKLFSLPE